MSVRLFKLITFLVFGIGAVNLEAQSGFKVIAFFTAREDQAHISFVHEANRWFSREATAKMFTYDSTSDWSNLNDSFLSRYQVVVFLDTRPEDPSQRAAFERYMKSGGSWLGFHFSAFALTPSAYPQNWDWYHNEFIGAGEYKGNTWRPTSAVLRVEESARDHYAVRNLRETFKCSPNEWYSWKRDLRKNKDIQILLSIDSASFPLGTGPKLHEIWHSGYYPVAWTNKNYRMIYLNVGHNDIDYENHTNKQLSFTFLNGPIEQMVQDAVRWLGQKK
ncbi:hypothetical protein WSM22_08990 [Cytophagales bacterium WSM2-2]|nr:hypothetical protein WSM22_08990 [Cytophagales bacterium WSM2-2]